MSLSSLSREVVKVFDKKIIKPAFKLFQRRKVAQKPKTLKYSDWSFCHNGKLASTVKKRKSIQVTAKKKKPPAVSPQLQMEERSTAEEASPSSPYCSFCE